MLEVHCFGVPEGKYKMHGDNHVSIYNDRWKDWDSYEVVTGVELCPVCDTAMRVFAIRGSTWLATCTPKHLQLLKRREKENLCVRCGRQMDETNRRARNWWCWECGKKVSEPDFYQFNLSRSHYEPTRERKIEYWHS